nr:DNA-binding protein [Halomonas alkaliantarctica]
MKSHDAAVVEMLRDDPNMALDYLRTAFDELDEEDGESAFLMALRHVVEAQGVCGCYCRTCQGVTRKLVPGTIPKRQPNVTNDDRRY